MLIFIFSKPLKYWEKNEFFLAVDTTIKCPDKLELNRVQIERFV